MIRTNIYVNTFSEVTCETLYELLTWWISGNPDTLQRTISFELFFQFWFGSSGTEITYIDSCSFTSIRHCLRALTTVSSSSMEW